MENEHTVDTTSDRAAIDEPNIGDTVIEEELLIEEISIDGMCGVY